uniref:Uncharacterized protein n=1 Tax=Anopheles epiroticus TaxID=199890 RepID=A0A182PIQ2_9DIPT
MLRWLTIVLSIQLLCIEAQINRRPCQPNEMFACSSKCQELDCGQPLTLNEIVDGMRCILIAIAPVQPSVVLA